jgi:hypothetical protein
MPKRKPRRTPPTLEPSLLARHPSSSLPVVGAEQVRQRVVGGLFPRDFVADMFGGAVTPFRERLLSIDVMVLCMLEFVLLRAPAFLAIVDKLATGKIPGVGELKVCRQAFYQRLKKLPHQLFLDLLEQTSVGLNKSERFVRDWVGQLASFANGVYALDDTTLDALVRRNFLLRQHPKGSVETLGGRLGCALDLMTGRFAQLVYDPDAAANEKSHIRPVIQGLPEGCMVVLDLGFFSFALFDWLTEGGRYFVTRMRAKTSFEVIEVLADRSHYRDRIIWLGKHRADRAAHPVRYVEVFVDGQWLGYVTNVLQPSQLNAKQVWGLYAMRWTIEMAFATIKRSLGMAYLRPAGANAMLIQIWSTLLVYQLLQSVRLEVAASQGWREDEISWEMLMRRVGWYAQEAPPIPLSEWLCLHADKLNLKKRGQRKRRRTELPDEVLQQALPPPVDPDLPEVLVRRGRQGDRQPLKSEKELVVVRLG